MKKIVIITLLLTCLNVFSQKNNKISEPQFQSFVLQCNNIIQTMIDKNQSVKVDDWYEGMDVERIKPEIEKLELNIDKSDMEITYYLVMVREEPLIYSLGFYNTESKTEFGQLLIRFKDKENNLVDYIKVIGKKEMEMINKEANEQPLPTNILPPPPPIEKKKNGN